MTDAFRSALTHTHSLLRYVLLLLLVIMIYKAYTGKGKRPFTSADKRLGGLTVLTAHFQLLIGFTLYFVAGWNNQLSNFSAAMSNTVVRFFGVEHMAGMLVAVVLLTIGNARSKRAASDDAKFKALTLFFSIALIIIFISIPWPFRAPGVARDWFSF